MTDVLNNKVSVYDTVFSRFNTEYAVDAILDWIKTEKFKREIDAIRNEPDKAKRDDLKKKLPAVTISSLFGENRKKANIKKHSGLIQVDLDNVEDIISVKKTLTHDTYTFALFVSPSGKGLKLLVKIPPEIDLHEKYFSELEKYYLMSYHLVIDRSCKDISRLMFLCSDKDIFINENSTPYCLNTLEPTEILFADAVQKINNRNVFKEGSRNLYVYKLACECKRLKLKENICLIYCTNYYSQIDFTENEIGKIIKSAYKEDAGLRISDQVPDTEKVSLLRVRTGQQCLQDARNKAVPKMLFDELWHEGELCFLFADTNVGKSIWAVQIANSISKGIPIPGFRLEAKKQLVFYLDFELGDKQFQRRYSFDYEDEYPFDDNFQRIVINPNFTDYHDFETELFKGLERLLKEGHCLVLIVDNITFLKTQSNETAKDALPLMRKLIELKNKYGLSMLILAHTPKRNQANPITINDLAGSKHLANFADSIFAIGISAQDNQKRYLKQIKARATEKIFDADNVVICKIAKPHNFLEFQFLGYDDEREHLKQFTDAGKAELDQKILDLRRTNPLMSFGEIALQLSTNKMRVKRVVDKNST